MPKRDGDKPSIVLGAKPAATAQAKPAPPARPDVEINAGILRSGPSDVKDSNLRVKRAADVALVQCFDLNLLYLRLRTWKFSFGKFTSHPQSSGFIPGEPREHRKLAREEMPRSERGKRHACACARKTTDHKVTARRLLSRTTVGDLERSSQVTSDKLRQTSLRQTRVISTVSLAFARCLGGQCLRAMNFTAGSFKFKLNLIYELAWELKASSVRERRLN